MMVDFYGLHVGKYTSPMDPMGNTRLNLGHIWKRQQPTNQKQRLPLQQFHAKEVGCAKLEKKTKSWNISYIHPKPSVREHLW